MKHSIGLSEKRYSLKDFSQYLIVVDVINQTRESSFSLWEFCTYRYIRVTPEDFEAREYAAFLMVGKSCVL